MKLIVAGPSTRSGRSTISWLIPRTAFYDDLEAFLRAGLGKRLMFGSDQMRWPEKIGDGIEAIEQAPFLTEEQKRDILYHNAVRFLRLEQEPEPLSPVLPRFPLAVENLEVGS